MKRQIKKRLRVPTPDMRSVVALVLTGSVATIKAFLLQDCLKQRGVDVRVIATPAAWPFIEGDSKYKASSKHILDLKIKAISAEDPDQCRLCIDEAGLILIAPASADFIRQLAWQDTEIGYMIMASGKPVAVAPAMNFMMWQHPAVQSNVATLLEKGVRFIGPVSGDMACGDHGFGRFADVQDVADNTLFFLKGGQDFSAPIHPALIKAPRLPANIYGACQKILVVVNGDIEEATGFIKYMIGSGYRVQAVLSPGLAGVADIRYLEDLTGYPVCWEHHQLYPKDGMEHIWLAEDSDLVIFYAASEPDVLAMVKGSADSFAGCIYLASKRPVIVIPRQDVTLSSIKAVQKQGAFIFEQNSVKNIVVFIQTLEKENERPPDSLHGKKIIVLGGAPREIVDSFRFYKNTARDEQHGERLAEALKSHGVHVTYISTIEPAESLVALCKESANEDVDAVVQMASISQFTCASPVAHKIQKTGDDKEALFDVVGKIDMIHALQGIFGQERVMGYNNYQEWVSTPLPFSSKIASLARRTQMIPSKKPVLQKREPFNAVVTTGRTEEQLTDDGVIITNGFTGRQGQEIAKALSGAGYKVLLISGVVQAPDVEGVTTIHVKTMQEMHDVALASLQPPIDVFVSVAAIADFSLPTPLAVRLKQGEAYRMSMIENPSIVGAVAQHKTQRPKCVVSFAAQSPETIIQYATEKFYKLGVDITVANPIGHGAATVRDASRNQITLIYRDGGKIIQEPHGEMAKEDVAALLVRRITGNK